MARTHRPPHKRGLPADTARGKQQSRIDRLALAAVLVAAAAAAGAWLWRAATPNVEAPPTSAVDPAPPPTSAAAAADLDANLARAVSQGDAGAARRLLAAGASASGSAPNGWPLLAVAAQKGSAGVAAALLEHGADADAVYSGFTPLLLSAAAGHLQVVRPLLAHAASTSATSPDGSTALHFAAEYGHADVAEALLRAGAPVEAAKPGDGTRPLHRAAENGKAAVVEVLLRAGASVDAAAAGEWRPLLLSLVRSHAALAVSLLEAGASPHHAREDGTLPLHAATRLGSSALVEALLDRGARIDAADKAGETALHRAVSDRGSASVPLLLRRGASAAAATSDYLQTPLHVAAAQGDLASAAELVAHGASAAARDRFGVTPQYAAAYHGHRGVAELLRGGEVAAAADAGACAGRGQRRRAGGGVALSELSVALPAGKASPSSSAQLRRAVEVWERDGVVLFPRLLSLPLVERLRRGVEAELRRDAAEALDRTYSIRQASSRTLPRHVPDTSVARPRVGYACSTRQASSRTLRAVDVREVSLAALEAIAARAGGFLRAALRSEVQVLLESSVMQTRSGAADQSFHADTGACDPRLASVQVSLVDTAADQGALEVAPGTQRGGAPAGEGEGTVVAVPAASMVFVPACG